MLKVVVAGRDKISRSTIVNFLKFKGYEVFEVSTKEEAIDVFEKERDIDVALLDVDIFASNKLEVIREIKKRYFSAVVILFVGLNDEEIMEEAARAGVSDLVMKPVDLPLLIAKLVAIEKFKKFHREKGRIYSNDKEEIEKLTQSAMKLAKENMLFSIELVQLAYTLSEYRDDETHAHTTRVGWISAKIAEKMEMEEEEVATLQMAAPLHDIGKIGIPDSILLKPGRLTDEEYEKMKMHTLIGYSILKNSSSKILRKAAMIALTHHERWDGSGYPRGLKGKEIPLEGLIVAVADSFDAMVCKRVYKDPIPIEKAFEEIKDLSGTWYSPEVVKVFSDLGDEVFGYYQTACEDLRERIPKKK
ncbi:MAG: HD domain-containing protein, partial [Thermotogaceae bacterium]|nr:HD domain-containing protein [Thermotogaceae bacterium]